MTNPHTQAITSLVQHSEDQHAAQLETDAAQLAEFRARKAGHEDQRRAAAVERYSAVLPLNGHAVAAGVLVRGEVLNRGEEFEIRESDLDLLLDTEGRALLLDLIADEVRQKTVWGSVRLRPGPAPADLRQEREAELQARQDERAGKGAKYRVDSVTTAVYED